MSQYNRRLHIFTTVNIKSEKQHLQIIKTTQITEQFSQYSDPHSIKDTKILLNSEQSLKHVPIS